MIAFHRAAFFLDDYCDMLKDSLYGDGGEDDLAFQALIDVARLLATQLKAMGRSMETKQAFDRPHQAAKIVADIMSDWRLPGAVWYSPRIKRFRLVGEGYVAKPADVLCGVYLPGADFNLLADDFDLVMRTNT